MRQYIIQGLRGCASSSGYLPYSLAYWSGPTPAGTSDGVDTTIMSLAVPLRSSAVSYNDSTKFDVSLQYFRKQLFSTQQSLRPALKTLTESGYSLSSLQCAIRRSTLFNATLTCGPTISFCSADGSYVGSSSSKPNSGRVVYGMKIVDFIGSSVATTTPNISTTMPVSNSSPSVANWYIYLIALAGIPFLAFLVYLFVRYINKKKYKVAIEG